MKIPRNDEDIESGITAIVVDDDIDVTDLNDVLWADAARLSKVA